MKLKVSLEIALAVASLLTYSSAALSQARKAEPQGEHRAQQPGSQSGAAARGTPQSRPAPQPFKAHPAGVHPHGPIVRAHATRVLSPRAISYGAHPWPHWSHPEFARPAYYWDWTNVHSVSCIAEDSYGDQYPVTELTFVGFGLSHMTGVEDDALDRCSAESGGDQTCYLVTCSHF